MTPPPSPTLSIPTHIATIMDGNGRWAKERGWSRTKGHKAGAEAVQKIIDGCLETGVSWLTLYAFSSENWSRPRVEVETLMRYLYDFLKKKRSVMIEQDIRFHTIGDISRLPKRCQEQILETKKATQTATKLNLVLALSYGARDEITEACRRVAKYVEQGTLRPEDITQETIASQLDTAGMPDPDLLIRTSGENRLSNFLLWQLSYAEFIILEKNWPDFTKEDLILSVEEYSRRHRRFGKI